MLTDARMFASVALIASLLSAMAIAAPASQSQCSGHPDGNYAHPTDCTKFLICVAQQYLYVMDCPANLHYDVANDRCEYPELAGCSAGQQPSSSTTEEPSSTSEDSETSEQTSTTEVEDNTSDEPSEGDKEETTTESDSESETTEPEQTTTPKNNEETTEVETTTSQEDPSTPESEETTTLAPEDPSTTESEETTSEVPVLDCSGRPDGNYPHPSDCTKFVACVAGEYVYVMDCPADLHYDPRTDRCEYPEIAECNANLVPTTTNGDQESTDQTTTENEEATTEGEITTSSPEEPSSTESEETTTSGPEETSTTESDETPTSAPEDPSTTESEETTSEVPVLDCSGRPDGNYPHPSDCTKFVACVAGEYVYVMDCPVDLHYDPRTDRCEYPEIAECNANMVPTTTNGDHESTDQTTTENKEATTEGEITTLSPEDPSSTESEENATTSPEQSTTQEPEATTTDLPETESTEHEQTTTPEQEESEATKPEQTTTPEMEETDATETEETTKQKSTTTTPKPSTTTPKPTTTTQKPTTTTRPPTTISCSGRPDGNYVHPTNCNKYVACVAQTYVYIMDCPANLQYDARTDRCDYASVVGCSN